MSSDISESLFESWYRNYDLFSCGYIKHRKSVLVINRDKNGARVAAKFRWLKIKYKSAWFHRSRGTKDLWVKAMSDENPLLKVLKRTDEFVGEQILIPIKYNGI